MGKPPAVPLAIALIILLAALPQPSAAACEGSISQEVPAVMGDNGGLVNVTISLSPGPGLVYTTVYPRTGVMTQESIAQAVSYAYGLAAEDEECDVLVDFSSNAATSYIDGPSAGAALTVMTYALLENRSLRNDTVMTGTIEEDGSVGPVGGLYEKAKGAAVRGAEYFITPVESIYEMMMLRKIEDRYGIRIIQASGVEEIIGFMAYNQSISQEGIEVKARGVPDVPPYDSSGTEPFRKIAQDMVGLERNLAASLGGNGNESAAAKEFFSSEADRQDGIIGRGYYFSAANEAFLNYIDLATIGAIAQGEPDLARTKGEAGICLTGIKRPALTDANFEWIIGADQRQGWAYEKLDSTEIDDRMLEDEKFAAYNELMYAQAWCIVGKELVSAAPQNGSRINESAWKGLAAERIAEADALGTIDDDYVRRLDIARSNFDSGRYGAAIYDAVYVIENVRSASEEPDEGNISALISEQRASLWGRVYQSHAAFLYAQNLSAAAYGTARFAKGLDEATDGMMAGVEYVDDTRPAMPPDETEAPGAPEAREDLALVFGTLLALSIFIFLVLLLILTRRKHGAYRTGPGEADRAEQEKGGAAVPGKGPRRKP